MFEKDGAIQLEGLQRHISKFDILRVAQFLFYLLSEIIPSSPIKRLYPCRTSSGISRLSAMMFILAAIAPLNNRDYIYTYSSVAVNNIPAAECSLWMAMSNCWRHIKNSSAAQIV